MSQAEKIIKLENKVKALTEQVDFISKRFGLIPDQKELEEAVKLMLTTRDNTALDIYIKRGGKIVSPFPMKSGLERTIPGAQRRGTMTPAKKEANASL
jgi:beta-lactamase class A